MQESLSIFAQEFAQIIDRIKQGNHETNLEADMDPRVFARENIFTEKLMVAWENFKALIKDLRDTTPTPEFLKEKSSVITQEIAWLKTLVTEISKAADFEGKNTMLNFIAWLNNKLAVFSATVYMGINDQQGMETIAEYLREDIAELNDKTLGPGIL